MAGKPPGHSGAAMEGAASFFRFVGVWGYRFWGYFLVAFIVFVSFLLVCLFVWSWGGFVLGLVFTRNFFFGFGWVGFLLFLRGQRINLFPCKKENLFERHAGERARPSSKPDPKEGRRSSLPAGVPVVGGPEEQRLAARAAVGRRVTAVHRRRHRVLLVPCGESSAELILGASGGVARGSRGSLGQLQLCPRPAGAREGPCGFARRQE